MPDWSSPTFDWDESNGDHIIERHDVYPEEAEQVFANGPHVRRSGAVYYAYGQDDAGRYLFVVFALRSGLVRVVSARPMTTAERSLHDRHR